MGRFLVLPPFALVAAQGTQKYLMRSLPSLSFCSDKPRTAPAPASDNGSPIYADHTIEHLHEVGLRYSPDGKPRYIDRHTRSKAALKAHLIMLLSVSAARIPAGIFSPCTRSYTTTSPPFTEIPKRSISNAGDSTYLYTPHFARSTSLNVSKSIDSVLILSIVHLKIGGKIAPAALFVLLASFSLLAALNAPDNIRNNYDQLRKCISKHISKADSKQNAFSCHHRVSPQDRKSSSSSVAKSSSARVLPPSGSPSRIF